MPVFDIDHIVDQKKHASGAITIENVGQTVIHPRHREKKIGNDTESNVSCKRGRLIKKKTPKGLVGFLFALAHRCLTRSIPVIASAVFYGSRNGPLSDLPLRARKKNKKNLPVLRANRYIPDRSSSQQVRADGETPRPVPPKSAESASDCKKITNHSANQFPFGTVNSVSKTLLFFFTNLVRSHKNTIQRLISQSIFRTILGYG